MIDKRQRALLAVFDNTPEGPDWRRNAACAQEDPEVWFPVTPDHHHQWDAARRICVTKCPVRMTCLEAALANREQHGMWGGYTPDERQALIRKREEGAA